MEARDLWSFILSLSWLADFKAPHLLLDYFILKSDFLFQAIIPNYYYYYYSLIRAFHISVSRWFLLESEWQQVASSLQDSSQYSGRSQ